jgi:hypothetical protein
MSSILRVVAGIRARLGSLIDDALPMPVDQRAERDRTGDTGEAEAARRQRQLRMEMLEKRGKGGYR